jgi:predicted transposase YbfD/YdcC
MASSPCLAAAWYFATLQDPRVRGRSTHRFLEVILIALCAVIAGANDWHQIVLFASQRYDWLKRFLLLPGGIPAHDTFERIFDRLDPQAFLGCFVAWMDALHCKLGLRHIAIDGKTLRGSKRGVKDLGALQLVSAWAVENRLVLRQQAVAQGSNEIPAMKDLLELLDLEGALVTIDALGCQKELARQIHQSGGKYILTVKGNQPQLREEVEAAFIAAFDVDMAGKKYDEYETREEGHGRKEYRKYTVLYEVEEVASRGEWAGMCVIGQCYREREVNGKKSDEMHYFISSFTGRAKAYGTALRGHWGIENHLHWQLDVVFREDANQVSRRGSAEALAILRRMALGLLQHAPGKESIAQKRYKAALNPGYIAEVIKAGCGAEKI